MSRRRLHGCARGVSIALEPVVVEAIRHRIAFFTDPFGNFVELAEVVGST